MLNQNTDLEVICCQVMLQLLLLQLQIVDSIKAGRRHNVVQDYQLTDHDNRISHLEKQNKEILRTLAIFTQKLSIHETQLQGFQDSVQLLEAEIPYLRHLVYRNEELQNERDFFCPPD